MKLYLAIQDKSANGFTNELYLLEVVFVCGRLHSAFQLVNLCWEQALGTCRNQICFQQFCTDLLRKHTYSLMSLQ